MVDVYFSFKKSKQKKKERKKKGRAAMFLCPRNWREKLK